MNPLLLFIKRHQLAISGAIVGIAAGLLYHYYIGCESRSCAITASPYLSSIWGGVFGSLLFSSFKKTSK